MKHTTELPCNGLTTLLSVAVSGVLAVCAGGVLLVMVVVMGGALSCVQAQEASTSYRSTGRDPFVKYKAPVRRTRVVKQPVVAVPVELPTIQVRIDDYKRQKLTAMQNQAAAPKPTTALLLNELQVVGIFRSPRGYAAMVEAVPIKLSYIVYPGEVFYNGQLVAIEENRLTFRRETRLTNGRREMATETKPLRKPDAVTDSMTATKTTSSPTATVSPEAGKPREEKPPSAP